MNLNLRVMAHCTMPVRWHHVRTIVIVLILMVLIITGHGTQPLFDGLIK